MNRGCILAITLLMLATGCTKTAPPAPAPPMATEDRVAAIRTALSQQSPGVVVAPIVEVLPSERLAAGSTTSPGDFHVADVVTIIDTNMQVIGTGRVVHLTTDQVHVRWELPQADQREPRVGDLIVLPPRSGQKRG